MPSFGAPRSTLTWTSQFGIPTVIELDAVRDIDDDRSSTLTQHAIESGALVTDHVISNPNILTITILSTNNPTHLTDQQQHTIVTLPVRPNQFVPRGLLAITRGVGAAVGAAVGLLTGDSPGSGNSIKVNVLSPPSSVQRVQELHAQLIDLKNNATEIEVVTGGIVYPDQILISVKKSTGPSQYGLGVFTCIFQKLTTVTATAVSIADAADLIARQKALKASQAKKELDAAQKAAKDAALGKPKSLLAGGLDAVGF